MSLTLSQVTDLLQNHGQNQYGMEAVNQLEHALQCADLAEKAGETAETIAASLLHDLGHIPFEEPYVRFRKHGLIIREGAKMSKTKGNVVNPDEYIDRFGARDLPWVMLALRRLMGVIGMILSLMVVSL